MSLNNQIDQLEQALIRLRQGDAKAFLDIQATLRELRSKANELMKRQAELATLYEIARELATVVDLTELLQLILTRALALAQAERGFIVLTDDSPDGFHVAVTRQYAVDERDATETRLSRSLMRRVLSTRTALVTTNAQEDPRFQASSSIVGYRIRSVMAVPLIYERELLGAIYLDTRLSARQFTQEDLALLEAMANQAAIAIHMARLYSHLEERNQQLQQAVAELRATQDELIRAERLSAIGRVASGIIHDFKTPMTTIKGYTAFLGENNLPAEDRKRFAGIVINAVDTLVSMAQEILDFVQGGGELHLEWVALGDFLSEIIEFLRDEFAEQHIEIHADLAYTGKVLIDKGKMRRVIMNIAGNARDAMMGKGGIFTIASRREEEQLKLLLKDNGPGIPPEILPRLFEPFVTHGKAHGIGLGLAISKKIIEDHGGSIETISQPGQGATFIITLPVLA